jgi:hypothetical protein
VCECGVHTAEIETEFNEPIQNTQSLDDIREEVRSEALCERGILYLQHETADVLVPSGKSWKIHGSPSAPRYAAGAFQYETTEEAKGEDTPLHDHSLLKFIDIYDKVPLDIELLLTHTPPLGTLDETRKGKRAGCKHLAEKLKDLNHCRLHVFGHIHEAYGVSVGPESQVSVNAAIILSKKPIVVDLKH